MTPCCNQAVVPDDEAHLVDVVNEAYSRQARQGANRDYAERVASAFGYTLEALQSVPSEAHMGLSCGNPVATASIKAGETVVDLGCGGGIDVFLAAAIAGPTGQVIGLDNSDDMIALARRNAATKGLRPPRVAFVQATLTGDLPIESGAVDCILSNCVVNLLPPAGKRTVMREVYRMLKPGGRVQLDDIIARKPYPEALRLNVAAYVGCIAGALLLEEYQTLMEDAGFKDVVFTDTRRDLNAYLDDGSTGCCGTISSATSAPTDIGDLNEWAASYHIYATKNDSALAVSPAPTSTLKQWWDAYPVPVSSPDSLACEDVAHLVRNPELGEKDFVVVDVRRDDHAGGHVRGSIQRPAQAFYDDLPQFYEAHKQTKRVIFYCGSSNGRGSRCAKWYQDHLDECGNTTSKAFVMVGGAKKWVSAYKEERDLVDFD